MAVLLGTLTTGGASDFFVANDLTVTRRQASASGSVDTMRGVFTNAGAGPVTFVLYADAASAPAALLGQTSSVLSAVGTVSATMLSPVAVTSGTFYWVGFWVATTTVNLTDSTPGGYSGRNVGSIPDPFGSVGFSDATNSLPVTGEDTGLAGGPGSGPLPSFKPVPFMRNTRL